MTAEQAEMIAVLQEAKQMLALPQNDFGWSSWNDFNHAAKEIDDHVAKLIASDFSTLSTVGVLFAPTGPIQEVSLSSGWGKPFLALATRFDLALISLQRKEKKMYKLG